MPGILDNPDKPSNLPSVAFFGCSNNQLGSILRLGLTPTDRGLVHLSVEKNDALAIARKRNPRFARIAQIDVNSAAQSGIKFKRVTPRVVVCEEIPPQFLTGIPVPRRSYPPEQRYKNFHTDGPSSNKAQRGYPSYNSRDRNMDRDRDRNKEEPSEQRQKHKPTSNYKLKRNPSKNVEESEITDEDFDFDIEDIDDDNDELNFDEDFDG